MGDVTRPQIFAFSEEPTDITLFDCRWVPCSTRFVVAGTHAKGHGILRVYTMGGGEKDEIKQLETIERKRHPFKCLTFGATSLAERQPATGDFDGNIHVWDLENTVSVWSVKGHSSIINAIDGIGGVEPTTAAEGDVASGAAEIVSGSRDGSVKVWDVRIKDEPVSCMKPVEGGPVRDCWSVAFGHCVRSSNRMVVAGFDNGDIKIFDLRSMKIYWETRVPTGVCSVAFDRCDTSSNKLVASCLDGQAHVWNLNEGNPKEGFPRCTGLVEEGRHTVWGGRFLNPNKDIFVTMGGSGSVALWKYSYPENKHHFNNDDRDILLNNKNEGNLEKLQECQISEHPVSGFDWSPDKMGLAVTTAFDQKIRLLCFTRLETV